GSAQPRIPVAAAGRRHRGFSRGRWRIPGKTPGEICGKMIEDALGRCVASWHPGATGVAGAAKLSGGASQETWAFDNVHPSRVIGAILRRSPKGFGAAPSRAAGLEAEARLMQLAHDAGLPSPKVLHVLTVEDDLGIGFIMQRVEGETIARKILRDA